MTPKIQTIVTNFIEALTAAIQEEGAAAFAAAIGGERSAKIAAPKAKTKPGPKPKSAPKPRKGAKRDPGELDALTERLFAQIKKTPGQGIEAIGKALGVATKELALPVKRLLDDRKIITKGKRRGTRYTVR